MPAERSCRLVWPELFETRAGELPGEMIAFYPHRIDTPKNLWLELILSAQQNIDLFAGARLFLPEDNPDATTIIRRKAERGVAVRILIGGPGLRGHAVAGG